MSREIDELLAGQRSATLATLSAHHEPGSPFGSLVVYALDEGGAPLLCLSDLAEHSRNLAADPRASLLVTEPAADPLAGRRATLVGHVNRLDGDARTRGLVAYRARFPDAGYVDFADFRLYRLAVRTIRFVGGFGRMEWLTAE
jgi:putative heme iron utilization protein